MSLLTGNVIGSGGQVEPWHDILFRDWTAEGFELYGIAPVAPSLHRRVAVSGKEYDYYTESVELTTEGASRRAEYDTIMVSATGSPGVTEVRTMQPTTQVLAENPSMRAGSHLLVMIRRNSSI